MSNGSSYPGSWRNAVASLRMSHVAATPAGAAWHNLINATTMLTWLWLLHAAVTIAPFYVPLPVYLTLGPPFVGLVMFTIYVIGVHESSHNQLFYFPSHVELTRNVNMLTGHTTALLFPGTDFFYEWWLGHDRLHHNHPNEKLKDPHNLAVPRAQMVAIILKLWFVPLYALVLDKADPQRDGRPKSVVVDMYDDIGKGERQPFPLWMLLLQVATVINMLILAFQNSWAGPAVVMMGYNHLQMWNMAKAYLEHGGDEFLPEVEDAFHRSRTWHLLPEWLSFVYGNINYHYEHHMSKHIPWYLLPAACRDATRTTLPREKRSKHMLTMWETWARLGTDL